MQETYEVGGKVSVTLHDGTKIVDSPITGRGEDPNPHIMLTIARIDRPIPELEYDGTAGYVIEGDGEFAGQHETLEAAKLAAGADVEWRRAEAVDWAGRTYWKEAKK